MKHCVYALTALLFVLRPGSAVAQRPSAQDLFISDAVVGVDADFSAIWGVDVLQNGTVLVLDFQRKDVTAISPAGKLLWRYGREGGGPGEFKAPIRILVTANQDILVIDPGRGIGRVIRLRTDGSFRDEQILDMHIDVVSVIALPSGEIALSGSTTDTRGKGAAIHLFSADLRHLRSFGRLADQTTSATMEAFGGGAVTKGLGGTIIHTRYFPLEISRYSVDGQLRSTTKVPLEVSTPASQIHVAKNGRTETQTVNQGAIRPVAAREVRSGVFLVGRFGGQIHEYLVIKEHGEVLSRFPVPPDWMSIRMIDARNSTVWATTEVNDVPALRKLSFGPYLTGR